MGTSVEAQHNQRLDDSPLEVSYSVFTIPEEQEKTQILQAIATAINVQLTLDEQDHIPFVPPNDFDLVNSQDRFFCYGPSGCGKSRIIFELAKIKLDEKIERIYIINPRQALDTNIQHANLMQLSYQFTCHDVVVWDNFPDGLRKKDTDSGKIALEIISSSTAKNLFIALKPKFLEIYRGVTEDIPDLYAYQVRYDINQIREIVRLYGSKMTQFKKIYANHVAQNITRITKVLWQKEPFPLTIFNYYRDMVAKETAGEQLLDAISEAQAMLYPTSYYEHQFEHLVNSKARRADAEFLYTIKLCYDLALDRKVSLVEHLQSQIFDSDPPKDTSRNLSSWVYLSGHYISMHDVPRDAIKFNDQIRLKIIDWLTDNFSDVISSREDQLDSLGAFLGRNIQLLMQHDDDDTKNQKDFLPYPIYPYMKSQRRFEVALGQGAGEVFYLLEQPLQEEVLSRIEKDGEFARGLGESLGKSFEDLDSEIRVDILSKRINQSLLFARGLGESLSNNFNKLSKPLQDEIFQISLRENNYNFQRGLGAGLGRKFRYLEADVQKRLLDLASKHIALAIGLGYGLAFSFTSSSVPKKFQNDIMGFAKENAEITRGLGMGLGQNYPFLNKMLQSEILRWTEKDPRLEFGFAYQLSFLYTSLREEHQNLIFDRVEKNSEFAYGSGFGFGVVYTYLPEDIQQRLLLDLAKRNIRFATGLGAGVGNQLQYLTEEREEDLLSNIEKNEGFATGLGFGIGRSFTFLSQELQRKVWDLMQTNYRFAVGLGWGLGFIFSYLHEDLQNKVLKYVQKELGFASGFGWGLGFMYTYLSTDLQQKANLLALQNSQFALGFGVGLGSLFNYLTQDLRQDVWRRAESNAQFAVGLGSELGYLFNYLPAETQQDILSRSQSNPFTARGLGWGLGHIFISLSNDRQQQHLFQDAQRNPQLLRGLGWGLGRILAYLSAELQQTIMRMANANAQFAVGLGEGLGGNFQHLDSQLRERGIHLSDKNTAIARGLGFGLGHIMKYLQPEYQQDVWRRAESNAQFAVGLGEGIGEVMEFLPLSSQDKIFARMEQNAPLSRGLGSGLAQPTNFYLTDNNISNKVAGYAKENKDFCRGYGEGLGRIFSYWTESILNDIIMPNTTLNTEFAVGLGEGVGQSLPYGIWQSVATGNIECDASSSSVRNESELTNTLERLFAFDGFSYGVGFGFSSVMEFMPEQTRTSVLQVLVPKYHNFALGLGYGAGRSFPSLNQKLQEEMLEVTEKRSEFARGFGHGIGFSFKYLEPMVQQGLLIFAEKRSEFARGFGHGIGSIFPSLNQKLQEEMLEVTEKSSEFARGFGQGLSHSFVYLDKELQTKLTASDKIKNHINSPLLSHEKKDAIAEFALRENDSSIFLSPNDVDKRDKGWLQQSDLSKENVLDTEIRFSGKRERYCICYIDMMNSTQAASTLNDLQLSKYYGIFLNSMATIAKNFGATIIKNAGDCLIYYFPSTSNSNNHSAFKNVIECGNTMISAHQAINAKLFEQRLPTLNYRISADYGKVEVAKSSSSQSEDLFGSTMNVCAKINSKAPANGMAIGHNLYQMVSAIMKEEYNFERIGEYSGFKEVYPVYSINTKQKRHILNPFKRSTKNIFDPNLQKDIDNFLDINGFQNENSVTKSKD